ncbi:MAG TPA: PQQ-dependent sugar dehydrogenase [Solirubrobacterales bacterium]|nr:PQQ-dependent sugar dehydrogenase [Solirubrobacterales bacterium]
MIRIATAIAVLSALAGAGGAGAATLQQVGVFERPMYVTSAPNNPDRLFVVERRGRIVEVQNGATSTFADLSSLTTCCTGEGGLQSIALAPDFGSSGRFYVFYTGSEGAIQIAEMRAAGNFAPLASLRPLLTIPHPDADNHYGGQLQIGPEGLLYASTGDGGGGNDQFANAQDLTSLLGKLLRIDPNPAGVLPYTGPPGNPFAGGDPQDDPIWSFGLRNPFRFSFDRESGATLIGDVGQKAREEVDYAPPGGGAGVNYGWACREGLIDGPRAAEPECAAPAAVFTPPIFDYPQAGPEGPCAIVGGYVVRDRNLGDLYGRYLYGDYCGEQLRSFSLTNPEASDRGEGVPIAQLTSFGEDACGRLYTVQETGRVALLVGNDGAGACPGAGQARERERSFVGIRAQGRRVKKGKRAQITAWVSPCAGRRGEPVKLMRGRAHLGTRRLDRACTVRFRPKISRRAKFRALIAENASYLTATSRPLQIKILHKKKAQRRGKSSGVER